MSRRCGDGLAVLDLADHLGRVAGGQRSHVASVDRCHRCHVARAEALELAQVEVLDPLRARLVGERLVDEPRVPQVAGDAGAHVHVAAARRLGAEHVVERRDARQVGGRYLHDRGDLANRLGRAPAVHRLRGPERGERRRVAVGIERHQALDLGAQLVRDVGLGRVRDRRGIGLEVDGLVPAGRKRRRADRALVAHLLHPVGHA
jgi:hypothetical protein